MNPLFFLLLVGGGYYFYDKKKKQEADRQRALEGETCVVVTRHGFQLICDENACRGLAIAPGADPDDPALKAFWGPLMDTEIKAVMGATPWEQANDAQARQVVNRTFQSVFPECQWAALPPTTKIGEGDIQLLMAAVKAIIAGMIAVQQGGGYEPPLPPGPVPQPPQPPAGENYLDRLGMRMVRVGPLCTRLEVQDEDEATAFFEAAFQTAMGQVAYPANVAGGTMLAVTVFGMAFPECAWPPADPGFVVVDVNKDTTSWPEIVAGLTSILQANEEGLLAMELSPGNIMQLGKLTLAQNPGFVDQLRGTYRQGARALKSALARENAPY